MSDHSTPRFQPEMDIPYSDHDLLIRIDTRLGYVINDVNSFKENTRSEFTRLWTEKGSKTDSDDHEFRIRNLERKIAVATGGILVVQVLIGVLLHYWK